MAVDTSVTTTVPDAPVVVIPDEDMELVTSVVAKANETASNARKALATIDNDPAKALVEMYETSDLPEVVKIRETIEALRVKADDILRPTLKDSDMSVEDAQTLLKSSTDRLKILLSSTEALVPGAGAYIRTHVNGIDDLVKVRKSSGGSGTTDTIRPRANLTVDGKPHKTMTLAASALSMPTGVLQKLWIAETGKAYSEIESGNTTTFNVKDDNGNDHSVTVVKQ